MPILPLDHPEPFAATLGVMLYPGEDDSDRRKARAFASHFLAEPIRRFVEDGGELDTSALRFLVTNSGERLDDLDKRWHGGIWTGHLLKAHFILYLNSQELASWENAIKIAEKFATRAKSAGVRSSFKKAQKQFGKAGHLWAAWSVREGKFRHEPDNGYEGWYDFQLFLAESETLREWGQNWKQAYAKAKPPLPDDVWHVPDDWHPPIQRDGRLPAGGIPHMEFESGFLDNLDLKPAVRKSG